MAKSIIYRSLNHVVLLEASKSFRTNDKITRAIIDIRIDPNSDGDKCYTVTFHDMEKEPSVLLIPPKPMKVIRQTNQRIIFKGYGMDANGVSFENYGLTIQHWDMEIMGIVFHQYDRDIEIVY
jgi:hypothetical protein